MNTAEKEAAGIVDMFTTALVRAEMFGDDTQYEVVAQLERFMLGADSETKLLVHQFQEFVMHQLRTDCNGQPRGGGGGWSNTVLPEYVKALADRRRARIDGWRKDQLSWRRSWE
jgi:hypothetical protein